MTTDARLYRLAQIAAMKRDVDLAQLSAKQLACDQVRKRLKALDAANPVDSPIPLQTLAEVAIRYERWADDRRARLNSELALKLASLLHAQENARRSFGRAMVLERLGGQPRDQLS